MNLLAHFTAIITTFISLSFFNLSFAKSISRYEVILKKMDSLAKDNVLVEKFVLGTNDTGDEIKGIKVGYPGDGKVNHLVVGTHHGNELDAAEVPMEFAKQVIAILNDPNHMFFGKFSTYKFTIIPVLNIQGYNRARREERDSKGKSHDPNRDYPDACTEKDNFKLKSTKLLADFVNGKDFIGAATIHGYIGTLTFPWGMFTTDYKTADHDKFSAWTETAVQHNGYRTGTHGGMIYPAIGAFEDWAYQAHGIWTVLLEVERGLSVENDAKVLVEYFFQVPKERSMNHAHTADCKNRLRMAFPVSRP